MNLDELKNIWEETSDRENEKWNINYPLLKEASIGKARSLLSEFKFTAIFETISYAIFWICVLGFIVEHWNDPLFAAAGILLGLDAMAGLLWGIYKWREVLSISYDLPLAEAQKKIARFQWYNRKEIELLVVFVPLFFVLFSIVAAKSFLGLNLFELLPFWKYPLIGSVVVGFLMYWILEKFPDRKLEEARGFLEEIKGYAKE